jgi:hypothetical protein
MAHAGSIIFWFGLMVALGVTLGATVLPSWGAIVGWVRWRP